MELVAKAYTEIVEWPNLVSGPEEFKELWEFIRKIPSPISNTIFEFQNKLQAKGVKYGPVWMSWKIGACPNYCLKFNHPANRGCLAKVCTNRNICLMCDSPDHGVWAPDRTEARDYKCMAVDRLTLRLEELGISHDEFDSMIYAVVRDPAFETACGRPSRPRRAQIVEAPVDKRKDLDKAAWKNPFDLLVE